MCRNDSLTHVTQEGQYAGMAANPGGSMLRNGGSMVAGMGGAMLSGIYKWETIQGN